jgi:hypothetical protein
MRQMENTLGGPREGWDSATLRGFGPPWPGGSPAAAAARSMRRPGSTARFVLRPGYGFPLDQCASRNCGGSSTSGWRSPRKRVQVQWYLLWRRCAGGLNAGETGEDPEKLLPC